MAEQPVAVVSVEVKNMPKKSKELAEKFGINFPVLFDEKNVARNLYHLRGTPLTLVLDPNGRVFFKHYGYSPGMEKILRSEIEELLRYPS